MSTPTQSQWTLRSILTAPFLPFLALLLSQHAKRLFYFASLYASLIPMEALKSDVMARLNTAMNLASSDDALMMPAALSRVVWGRHDVARILDQGTGDIATDGSSVTNPHALEVRAYELVSMTSRWMRFGTVDEMKNETMKFLRFLDQYKTADLAVA